MVRRRIRSSNVVFFAEEEWVFSSFGCSSSSASFTPYSSSLEIASSSSSTKETAEAGRGHDGGIAIFSVTGLSSPSNEPRISCLVAYW